MYLPHVYYSYSRASNMLCISDASQRLFTELIVQASPGNVRNRQEVIILMTSAGVVILSSIRSVLSVLCVAWIIPVYLIARGVIARSVNNTPNYAPNWQHIYFYQDCSKVDAVWGWRCPHKEIWQRYDNYSHL